MSCTVSASRFPYILSLRGRCPSLTNGGNHSCIRSQKILLAGVLKSFALASPLCVLFGVVSAQGTPDAGALQQNLERQIPLPSAFELPQPSRPQFAPLDLSKSTELFTVKAFEISGVKLLPLRDIQRALKPWLNRALTFAELQKAMNAIETVYRDKGYLAQAILSPQVLESGVVKVEVLEAKLGGVVVEPDKQGVRFNKNFAAKFVTHLNKIGEAINIDDISRSLTILNEVPGIRASSTLEAGDQTGETNLRVSLSKTNWISARAESNNYGSRTTGMWQGVLGATLNNPLGYGDQLSLNGIAAQGSQYTQGSYNVPLGASGLRMNLSASYLSYTNVGGYAMNGSDGTAAVLSADLSYPLIRLQATNLNLTARYDNKTYLNNNLATGAVVSQYSINNIVIGMTGNHFDGFLGGGVTTASLGLVYGQLSVSSNSPATYGRFIDIQNNYVSYLPKTYAKITYNLNRNQTLVVNELSLKLNLSGQFASVNLNSAEQFYLGGPYGIRAYPVSQAGGSQGAMLNIELQQKLPHELTGIAFFDAGTIQQFKNPYINWQGSTRASNIYSLAGAGVGIKYATKGFSVAATVAWRIGSNPLYSQAGIAVNTDSTNTNPMVWLSASYQL